MTSLKRNISKPQNIQLIYLGCRSTQTRNCKQHRLCQVRTTAALGLWLRRRLGPSFDSKLPSEKQPDHEQDQAWALPHHQNSELQHRLCHVRTAALGLWFRRRLGPSFDSELPSEKKPGHERNKTRA